MQGNPCYNVKKFETNNFLYMQSEHLLGMSVLDVEAEEDACEDDTDGGEHSHREEEADGDHPGHHHLYDGVRRWMSV